MNVNFYIDNSFDDSVLHINIPREIHQELLILYNDNDPSEINKKIFDILYRELIRTVFSSINEIQDKITIESNALEVLNEIEGNVILHIQKYRHKFLEEQK